MIPKIIWQTHEWELEDLPDTFKKSVDSWKNMNPTWDYRYTSARKRLEHIRDYGGEEFLKFYKDCNRLTQADLWRYVVLYKFGGVYSDLDWECIRPLDDIIEIENEKNPIIIHTYMEDQKDPYNNSLIGSDAGQLVFKKLIDDAIGKFRSTPEARINEFCGYNCCHNNDRECNGRNDYHLGYEYFSRHLEEFASFILPKLCLIAKRC